MDRVLVPGANGRLGHAALRALAAAGAEVIARGPDDIEHAWAFLPGLVRDSVARLPGSSRWRPGAARRPRNAARRAASRS
jgi:uncharacterized protein YbjT (DUF2867 family)